MQDPGRKSKTPSSAPSASSAVENAARRKRHEGGQPHPFDGVDLRVHPEQYRIGRGEYGVFHAEPYKGELLPLWKFRTPADARTSADAIWVLFLAYRDAGDWVGMDVARKFLQMGFTRARRYAKFPGGRKYDADGTSRPVIALDSDKAESAHIFWEAWQRALADPTYQQGKQAHQRRAKNAPEAVEPSGA